MAIKKRLLFRMAFIDRNCKAEELINIIKNIDDNKFEVSILLDYHEGNLIKDIPADIKVMSLVKGRKKMRKKTVFFYVQLIYIQLYRCFPYHIKNKIRRFPDIEIDFSAGSLRGLLKSSFRESVKIFWFSEYNTTKLVSRLVRMMSRCSIVVSGSRYAMESFENHLGAKVLQSLYIHPYINWKKVLERSLEKSLLIEEQFAGSEKVFVSMGSLTYDKGYDTLLAAHAELLHEGFEHKVLVIGEGSEYESLRKMIRWLKVENSFQLVGKKSNPYPYIQSADYYIQPSRYEPYPLIMNEFMVLNKPIISTAMGSIGELLGQWKTAYLIDFDTNEIKEAMKKFLCDESFVKVIVEQQKKFDFRTYNQNICDQVTDLFKTKQ